MKIIFTFSLIAALFLAGCKSPEKSALVSVASITSTVDAAMNGWGDAVRAGITTKEQEAKVRDVFVKYQASMAVAEAAVIATKSAPENEQTYKVAVSVLAQSADEVIALISAFQKSNSKP